MAIVNNTERRIAEITPARTELVDETDSISLQFRVLAGIEMKNKIDSNKYLTDTQASYHICHEVP